MWWPICKQVDELVEEATDLVGLVAANAHLVAADADLGAGEGVLDLAQVLISGTDESGHQLRARHDDGRRGSGCRHVVVGTFTAFADATAFPGHAGRWWPLRRWRHVARTVERAVAACTAAIWTCSTFIGHASVAVIGNPWR